MEIATKIAKNIRHINGGFRYVKAMGVELKERNITQVSINMTDYTRTALYRAFELVRIEARRYGVTITFISDLTSFLIAFDYMECVTCGRSTIQSQNQCRFGRSCFLDALVTFVEHSLHTSVAGSRQYDVSYFQSSRPYGTGISVQRL